MTREVPSTNTTSYDSMQPLSYYKRETNTIYQVEQHAAARDRNQHNQLVSVASSWVSQNAQA